MARRLTLTSHLMEAIGDLRDNVTVTTDVGDASDFVMDINTFLDEMVRKDANKIFEARSIVKDEFGSRILEDVMCEISEEDDYLNESINKELNKRITTIINEWLVEKLKNNG
jgi:hypothetical protein